jgi:predicted DNA-binding transcriptional regulator YafY
MSFSVIPDYKLFTGLEWGRRIPFDRRRAKRQKGGDLSRKESMAKVRSQVYGRVPWERIMRFHQLIQNREYPNCSKLAAEFAVSVRTLMRDVEFMKDRLNLPLEFDAIRNGYYYTRPVEHFPQVAMSEAEVFALLVAQKAVAQYHGTPFERPLGLAFRRLTGQLDRTVAFSLGNLEQAFSFRPFAPEDADLEQFQILTRAVKERRELRFLYRNLGAAKAHWRQVRPYHVACVDNRWYLFAYDVKRSDMRTFALSRLRSAELTGKRFTIPQRFDLNEYLRGSFNVFKGADDYEVVVEFDAWAGDLVRERKWHSSQELATLRGRQVRLRLRLNSIEEAERWVLSWGTHATVIRPDRLRERLAAVGKELAEKYAAE